MIHDSDPGRRWGRVQEIHAAGMISAELFAEEHLAFVDAGSPPPRSDA